MRCQQEKNGSGNLRVSTSRFYVAFKALSSSLGFCRHRAQPICTASSEPPSGTSGQGFCTAQAYSTTECHLIGSNNTLRSLDRQHSHQ
jgi:hypothetical protein